MNLFLLAIAFTTISGPTEEEKFHTSIDTLHEVIVTGTQKATHSNLIPYSISTIDSKEIESTGRNQLLSALSCHVPGLFVSERNIFGFGISTGGSGHIRLRGVGGSPTSQILMMVDGKPQYAGVFSHPIADYYESEYVDHVEILRGPASVLYGSNAMGGAINIITRNAKEQGIKTIVKSQYGSYNTWQNTATSTMRYGKFSSLISLGYDRTDGTLRNFDFRQGNGYVKLGYDITPHWSATADASLNKFSGNDPIFARLSNPLSTDIYHQDVLRCEASASCANRYDHSDGALRLYYEYGDHKIRDPKDFRMLDDRIGLLTHQNFQPWEKTHITVGFDFNRYSGKVPLSGGLTHQEAVARHIPTTMERKEIIEYAPYLTASQELWNEFMVLNAGIRMAGSNPFGTKWIPQGGLIINPGKGWVIKANVSKGYRNPSFKELYLYKTANPALDPEFMTNWELSLEKRISHYLSVELTAFTSRGNNLIQTAYSDMLKHECYVNTGKFNNKGLELSATSHPINVLHLRANYSYLHSDIDNLTCAPTHQFNIGADWSVLPKLLLNANLTGVSRLFVASDMDKQDYALLDVRLTYHLLGWVDLFVQGNNLTDSHYYIHKGYAMPGITASGGFKLKF